MGAKDIVILTEEDGHEFRRDNDDIDLAIPAEDAFDYGFGEGAKVQAPISFKAGKKEQLKDCLSDLTGADGAGDLKTLEKNITDLIYSWQAKLKEMDEEKKPICPHSETTIIDDKRLCVDCGEEVIREDDEDSSVE